MIKRVLGAALAVTAIAFVVLYWRHGPQGDAGIQHWLALHTGTVNEPGPYYGFWSGFGSDLSEAALIGAVGGALAGLLHKHNCHERGCWRIGRHQVEGSPWCNRHHQSARERAEQTRRDADPLTAVGLKIDRLADEIASLAEVTRAALQQLRLAPDSPSTPPEGAPQC